MAMPKISTLFLIGLLICLLFSGCGGQPLSKREIVRAIFFAQQGNSYSVCLLLADQNAREGGNAFKTASAAAATPAKALENAAAALPGTVYYGLLDAGNGRRRLACCFMIAPSLRRNSRSFCWMVGNMTGSRMPRIFMSRCRQSRIAIKSIAACSNFSPREQAVQSRRWHRAAGIILLCWQKMW